MELLHPKDDEELRKETIKIMKEEWFKNSRRIWDKIADKILSNPKLDQYAKLDDNQSLPPKPEFYDDWGGQSGKEGYVSGQDDMLQAGFRKLKLKDISSSLKN